MADTHTENVQRCLLSVFVDATLIRSWCALVVDASKKLVYICCFVELFCFVEREIQTIDRKLCTQFNFAIVFPARATSNVQRVRTAASHPIGSQTALRTLRKSVDACSVSQSEIAIRGDRKWDNLYFTFSVSNYFTVVHNVLVARCNRIVFSDRKKHKNALLCETGKIVLTHSIDAECKWRRINTERALLKNINRHFDKIPNTKIKFTQNDRLATETQFETCPMPFLFRVRIYSSGGACTLHTLPSIIIYN